MTNQEQLEKKKEEFYEYAKGALHGQDMLDDVNALWQWIEELIKEEREKVDKLVADTKNKLLSESVASGKTMVSITLISHLLDNIRIDLQANND